MRLLLNFLAVIGGLYSGMLVVAGCLFCARGIGALLDADSRFQGMPLFLPFLIIVGAGSAVLGVVLTVRSYRHLRRPNRNTANDVAGIATFIGAMVVLSILRKNPPAALSDGEFDPFTQLGLFAALALGAYLFYRLVLKRLVAQVYPPDALIAGK
jgi:hypothetical protein